MAEPEPKQPQVAPQQGEAKGAAGPALGSPAVSASATAQAAEINLAAGAKQLQAQVIGLLDTLNTLIAEVPEPPLLAEERALLARFDALSAESRRGVFLGTPDAEGQAFLTEVRGLMQRMLAEMEGQRRSAKPRPPKKGLNVIGGRRKMGQRTREKQAGLFFDKLMSTGRRPRFYQEEPINITVTDEKTGASKTRPRTLEEWRDPALLGVRLARVLKYSALPSASRHHWGTDVDVGDVSPKRWQSGDLAPMGRWLEANRAVLPLKTTYSGARGGGYHDEPWHLTMGTLGQGLHTRFDAQMDVQADVIPSILEAFELWSSKAKLDAGVVAATKAALPEALGALDVGSYIDEVHPDVKPEP